MKKIANVLNDRNLKNIELLYSCIDYDRRSFEDRTYKLKRVLEKLNISLQYDEKSIRERKGLAKTKKWGLVYVFATRCGYMKRGYNFYLHAFIDYEDYKKILQLSKKEIRKAITEVEKELKKEEEKEKLIKKISKKYKINERYLREFSLKDLKSKSIEKKIIYKILLVKDKKIIKLEEDLYKSEKEKEDIKKEFQKKIYEKEKKIENILNELEKLKREKNKIEKENKEIKELINKIINDNILTEEEKKAISYKIKENEVYIIYYKDYIKCYEYKFKTKINHTRDEITKEEFKLYKFNFLKNINKNKLIEEIEELKRELEENKKFMSAWHIKFIYEKLERKKDILKSLNNLFKR